MVFGRFGRMTISPDSPASTGQSFPSTTSTSAYETGFPELPIRRSSGVLYVAIVDVCVIPYP